LLGGPQKKMEDKVVLGLKKFEKHWSKMWLAKSFTGLMGHFLFQVSQITTQTRITVSVELMVKCFCFFHKKKVNLAYLV